MRKHEIWLAVIATLVLAACAPIEAATQEPLAPLAQSPVESQPTPDCPITPTVIAEPPDDPNADPFGSGPWVINEDRTIWVGLYGGWAAGDEGNKVLWIRPAGTQLAVSGRLLDGEAPPLKAIIPCCYTTGFQVTGLHFPTGGCWEVTATAGESRLQFVIEIPQIESP